MIDLVTITGPTVEPVSTSDLKDHSRITTNDDDLYVLGLIGAARQYVEGLTNFRLMTQTIELRGDSFDELADWDNGEVIKLRTGKVTAVSSIKYDDTDDAEQTYSSSNYWTDLVGNPARVRTKTSWPTPKDKPGAVRIRMTAGWSAATDVPEHFKLAIRLLVGHWYENREATTTQRLADIPYGIEAILQNSAEHMVYRLSP